MYEFDKQTNKLIHNNDNNHNNNHNNHNMLSYMREVNKSISDKTMIDSGNNKTKIQIDTSKYISIAKYDKSLLIVCNITRNHFYTQCQNYICQ